MESHFALAQHWFLEHCVSWVPWEADVGAELGMQEDYLRGRGPPVKDTTRMLQALAGIAAARCRWDLPTDQQGALEQTVPLEWSSDGQKWPGACALLGSVMSLRRGGGAVSIWRHGSGERWALS